MLISVTATYFIKGPRASSWEMENYVSWKTPNEAPGALQWLVIRSSRNTDVMPVLM